MTTGSPTSRRFQGRTMTQRSSWGAEIARFFKASDRPRGRDLTNRAPNEGTCHRCVRPDGRAYCAAHWWTTVTQCVHWCATLAVSAVPVGVG